MKEQELLSRITRDISDGLIVLDLHGNITFINPNAKKLLGVSDDPVGKKYASVMMENRQHENDTFHQFLLDAVYDKEKTHAGELEYTGEDGIKRRFRVHTSFLFGEYGTEKEGVVIQVSDETEEYKLRTHHRDTARWFVIMIAMMSLWVFFYAIWDLTGRTISSPIMSRLVELIGFLMLFLLRRYTDIPLGEMGLRTDGIKCALITDSIITAGILLLMIAAKMVIRRTAPGVFGENAPFFYWKEANWADYFYPVTVVVQEFLARGVLHEGVLRVLPKSKYADAAAIGVSSLFFGVLHVQMGLGYMLGAFLLMAVFGVVYRKQKTIWGLCIPHFIFGEAMKFVFGFM